MIHLQTVMSAESFSAFNTLYAASQQLADSAGLFTDAAGTVVAAGDRRRFLASHLAGPFLSRYLNRSPFPPDVSDERVGFAAGALAEALEITEHHYVEVRPLLNVLLTEDEIPIAENVLLRRVSDEDVILWLNEEGMSSFLPGDMPLEVFAALERRYRLPVGTRQELPRVDTLDPFPALLGLMADADCRAPMVEHRCVEPDHGLISRSGGSPVPLHGQTGKVRPDDGPRLLRWAKRLEERSKNLPLDLALERWQEGTNRSKSEDQLIDYWIALEALFGSDSRGEIRFRCSLRIAAYIGKDPDERVALCREMRDSYDARSALVHGDDPKVNVRAVAGRTRECLRRALIRVLDEDVLVPPVTSEETLLRR
jgi:hypothetical protein